MYTPMQRVQAWYRAARECGADSRLAPALRNQRFSPTVGENLGSRLTWVTYVANIYKYYIAYKLLARAQRGARSRQENRSRGDWNPIGETQH